MKHLEFIQDIIKRMAGNSFLLRGWSITLVTGLITLFVSTQDAKLKGYLLPLALFLVFIFWLLDAFYLSQERAYISLYDEVRKKPENEIDFSLNAKKYLIGRNTWTSAMLSVVFLVFYGTAMFMLLAVSSKFIGINIYFK